MRASTNGKATPRVAQVIAALTALATAPRAVEAQVPAEVTSDPDAVSWSAGRVDLFARAQDNTLWHQWWEANRWNGPESLGGGLLSAPGVASWGLGRLDVFVQGANNTLCQKWWEGQRWSEWTPLGGAGQITSAPAAVSWASGRVDVFARGAPDGLWHMWFDGQWRGPENLGGGLVGGPAASTWGPNRLDTFVRGGNHGLYHDWYDGQWHDWESLTGANTMTSDPAAVSWGRDRLDVFYRGADNTVQQVWWDGTAWRGPVSLGGAATSGPTASSRGPNRLEVFVRGEDNRIWRRAWDGTAWDTWERVSTPRATPTPTPTPTVAEAPAAPTCLANQVLLDGTSCVTLTPWTSGSALPDGTRVAIRLRRSLVDTRTGSVDWRRWVGLSPANNRTLGASDEALLSRDVFTLTPYPDAQAAGRGFWYILRAANGAYVSHWRFVGTDPGTLFAAATDRDEALIFGRLGGERESEFLNTMVSWGDRATELNRRLTQPGWSQGAWMCQSPLGVHAPSNRLTFAVAPGPHFGCFTSGNVDFFVVQ